MKTVTIDFTRCAQCKKRPRGKLAQENFTSHRPFCSYHCQETHNMDVRLRMVANQGGLTALLWIMLSE